MLTIFYKLKQKLQNLFCKFVSVISFTGQILIYFAKYFCHTKYSNFMNNAFIILKELLCFRFFLETLRKRAFLLKKLCRSLIS